MTSRKRPEELRSHRWLGVNDLRSFGHRSRLRQIGYDSDRLGRKAGHRHYQYLERHQPVSRAPAHARRGGQARRAAGRRISDRTAGAVARRNLRQADHHALSQSAGDGGRGTAAQPSGRRRGAARRLRQDHAGPVDGRDQHGRAGDLHAGGPDAARQLARAGAGLGLRHLEILGRETRRPHHRGAVDRNRRRHRPLVRHLHDHGHRRHHDGGGRGARLHAARRFLDPGARFQSPAHGHRLRPPHRRHGVGRPHARQNPQQKRRRQRHQSAYGDGRLDQLHHSFDRHRAPRRHRARHGSVRRIVARSAGDHQCAAVGFVSDGGFLSMPAACAP